MTAVVCLYGAGLALLFMVGCWFDRDTKDTDD
jgi:hypothetical protein